MSMMRFFSIRVRLMLAVLVPLILVSLSNALAADDGHILDENTVALWRLNEASASSNTVDETGIYHLTQFGNPDAISGRIGNGRLLNGSTKYFQGAGDASLGAALNGNWTYEGWVYLDPSISGWIDLFVYNGLAFSINQQDTILAEVGISPARKIYWHQWHSTGTYTEIASNITLQPGQYYHIAVSRTAQGGNLFTYRLYVNGIIDTTTTDVTGLSYAVSGASHYIGLGNFTSIDGFGIGGNVLNGRLDDTRISKIARTDAEILVSSQRAATALTVNRSGAGSGMVRSSITGIDCGGTCSGTFPQNSVVTLSAIPNAGSYFTGWSGDACAGNVSLTCMVTMDAAKNVTAGFTITQPPVANWSKTYGGTSGDGVRSVQQTSDGGSIVAGYTWSFGAVQSSAWLLKLDADGNPQWQRSFGGAGQEGFDSVQQTADGGYIVAGSTDSSGAGGVDAWIMKLDASGGVVWQNTYGGAGNDGIKSIQQTADGGYIAAGFTWSFGAGSEDGWIMKLNAGGGVVWQKTYGGVGIDSLWSIRQTADGDYIAAGDYGIDAVNSDAWLLKLDASGAPQWQKRYGGALREIFYSVEQTTDGGYIAAGYTSSFGAGGKDAWVVELDGTGGIAWQKTFGNVWDDQAKSVRQTFDGGYIVSEIAATSSTMSSVGILKLDSAGTLQWQKSYDNSFYPEAETIQQTAEGGYMVAAATQSFGAGGYDVWLLKLDSNGDTYRCLPGAAVLAGNVAGSSAAAVTSFLADAQDGQAVAAVSTVTPVDTAETSTSTQVCAGGAALNVGKTGTGNGTVTANSGAINCGAVCTDVYDPGASVTLSVVPDPGSTFTGWTGGGCSGAGPCTVTLNGSVGVTATFSNPQVLVNERFDAGLPTGWTVVDNTGNGGWVFWPPTLDSAVSGNLTGGTGGFAIADSNYFSGGDIDTAMISPAYNLSSLPTAWLHFKSDFSYNGTLGEIADVDVSSDGGTTWTNVWRWTGGNHSGPKTEQIDISATAAGKPNVKVRFHYYNANYDWWWQVDDVLITQEATGDWIITTIDRQARVIDWYPSVAVDGSNAVHIAYMDYDLGGIQYATNASGSWAKSTAYNGGARSMQLAMDRVGKVHIRFSDNYYGLWYLTNSGGDWSATPIEGMGGYACAIAADSTGFAHIAGAGASGLSYATNKTGEWTSSGIPGTGSPYGSSIKVDAENSIHIAYADQTGWPNNDHVKYAANVSGSWTLTDLDTLECRTCTETALALDAAGKPHISWLHTSGFSAQRGLRYASNASGAWQQETVPFVPQISGFPRPGNSLALDTGRNAHMSFLNNSDGALSYATNASGSWELLQVNSAGQPFWGADFNAIAYGGGRPHIAYGDRYDGGLFYATKANIAQPSTPIAAISPATYDFGNVPVGGSASSLFTIANTGTAPLTVTGIAATATNGAAYSFSTTGGATCASTTPTIAAGSSCTVNVTFAPLTLLGHGETMTVSSNAPDVTASLSSTGTVRDCTWQSAASGNWSLPANWSCGAGGIQAVPGITDNAIITVPGTYIVTLDTNATLNSLTIGGSSGTLRITSSGRTLTLNNASSVVSGADVIFTNITVAGVGKLTNHGTLTLDISTVNAPLDNAGTLTVYSYATINGALTTQPASRIALYTTWASPTLSVANGFTNNGTISLEGPGSGSVNLYVVSGTLTNLGSINIPAGQGNRTLTTMIDNQGTMTIDAPLALGRPSAAHTNSGTITINDNLTLTQSGTSPSFANTGAISIANGKTFSVSSGEFNYNSGSTLSGSGALSFSYATMNLGTGFTNADVGLTLVGTTINGPGALSNAAGKYLGLDISTVNAPLDNAGILRAWNNGTVNGALTTQPTSTIALYTTWASPTLTVANGFTNNGTISLEGPGSGSVHLYVAGGALTNLGSINIPAGQGNRTLTSMIDNQGTMTIDAPLALGRSSAAHTNSGTITINDNLTLTQSGTSPSFTNTGAISIGNGKTFSVSSGVFNYNTGSTLSGSGTLWFNYATLNLGMGITNASAGLALIGTTVNGPGTLSNAAGKTITLDISTVNAPLDNAGTLTVYNNGTVNGALTTQPTSTISLDTSYASPTLTIANGFTNNGTIAFLGTTTGSESLNVTSGTLTNFGAINNQAGLGTRTLSATIDNQGTMTIDAPLTINKSSAAHANSGTISINNTLTISGATSFSNSASGTLQGGSTLNLSGASFTNNGTLTAATAGTAGTLTVTGALSDTAFAVTNIEIGGTTAGTQYDQIAISGAANLAGTLNVSLLGYTPSPGDSFTIMTYGSRSGAFAATSLPALGAGQRWNIAYGSNSVVLSVVADAVAPSVLSTAPLDGATGIFATTAVTASFSEQMDAATIDGTTFTLYAGATPVAGSVSYDLGTNTARFTPSSPLSYNTTYTATITTGVKDLAGNSLAANTIWTFTTWNLMGGAIQGTATSFTNTNAAVTTLAGSGATGAIDATGTSASFYHPELITTDGTNLYAVDQYNHKIRKIVIATGVVTTLAGSGAVGSTDATGTAASFNYPVGITTDGTSLFVTDVNNHKIRKIVISTGAVTTLAGSGAAGSADGTGAAGSFGSPYGITTDGTNLFVADWDNHRIRKIVISTGVVTTIAGTGTAGSADGTGTAASFSNPHGLTTDGTHLFVADYSNRKIRQIVLSTGVVTTLAGSGTSGSADGTGATASFSGVVGLTTDGTNLFVADSNRIRKMVIATGVVTTIAGSGAAGSTDGTGTGASFNSAHGLTSDGTSLFVAEYWNHKIRKISPDITPPTVSSTSPVTGATGVTPNGNVTITWNENIDCTSVNTTNITIDSGGWSLFSCSGNQAVFTTSGQTGMTPYTVTVGTAVKDIAGNALASDFIFGFATGTDACNWNSAVSGSWSDTTKWSCGHAPGTNDDAFITIAGTYTVTLDTTPVTVNSLNLGHASSGSQTLSLPTKTLNISSASSIKVKGKLSLNGGIVNGPGVLDNAGTIVVAGSASSINASMTSTAGSMIRLDYANLTVANGFTNNGTIQLMNDTAGWAGNVTLAVTAGTLTNAPGGVIDILEGTPNYYFPYISANIDNQGTINSSNSFTLNLNKASATYLNSGMINVNQPMTISGNTAFTNTGTISIASGKTFTLNSGTFNHNGGGSIIGAGIMTFSGTTPVINLNTDFNTVVSTINFNNATVNGPGTLVHAVGKTITLNASAIASSLDNSGTIKITGNSGITGSLTSRTSSMIRLDYANLTVANGFTNNGTIQMMNDTSWWASNITFAVTSGTLTNAPGGVIDILEGAPNYYFPNISANIDNQGTINSSNSFTLNLNKASATYSNSGTINVNQPMTISNLSSFTNTGTITIASGKTFTVNGGTFNYNSGGSISGAGTLTFSGTTPVINLNTDFNTVVSTINFNNATVNGPGTLVHAVGKTITLNASTIASSFDNSGTIKITGNSGITGSLTSRAGSMIRLDYANLTVANGFTNNGTIQMMNDTPYWAGNSILTVTNGTLTNAPGGVIDVLEGATNYYFPYISANIDNKGTLNSSNSSTLNLNKASANYSNSGTINVNQPMAITGNSSFSNTGTITIASGKTFSISGGAITNATTGLLQGSGILNVSGTTFSNSANVAGGGVGTAGKLTVTGTLPDTAAAITNIDIGGLTAVTQYDQIAVSGAATLNGTLNVNLINGFTPNIGDSFTIMTYGSHTGTFSPATTNLPALTGKLWNIAYNTGSVEVSVVSADVIPPTAVISYSPSGSYKSGTVVTITATFSEPMAAAPAPQIVLSGADSLAATNMTRTDATHYTYGYTAGNGNGVVSIILATGTDLEGNVVITTPTSGGSYVLDNSSITLGNLSQIYDGTPKVPSATTTPPGLSVTYSYTDSGSNPVINPTSAGTYNVTATIVDPIFQGSTTGTLTVNKANQTITLTSTAPAATVGGATYTPTATGGESGNAVTFSIDASSTAGCSIDAGVISFTGVGNCVIDANQAGNGNYNPATQVQQAFAVGKGTQATLSVTGMPGTAQISGANFTVGSSGGSGSGAVTFLASGACSNAGTLVAMTSSSGTCSVTATKAADLNYNITSSAAATVAAVKTTQTINFGALATKTYGNAPFAVSGSATSGLPVSFSILSGPATIFAGTVTLTGVGTVVIRATQTGDATYVAATPVDQSFTVTQATLTVTADSASRPFNTTNPTFTASYSGYVGTDTFASSVTGAPGLTTTAILSSPVGPYPITAAVGTLASTNYSFSYVPGTLTVGATTQTINFGILAAKIYGAADYAPGASATSGLAVSYASSNPAVATIVGGTIHIIGAGTTNITASQAGDATYTPASDVVQPLTVNKASLTVTASSTGKTYGSANSALTVSYAGFVNSETAANLSTQPTATTTALTGSLAGSYPITASGGVSGNYSFTYVAGTLTVTPAPLTVTADNKSKTQGSANPALTVSYAGFVNGDTAASLSTQPTASTTAVTGSPAGTYPITASGGVSGNYSFTYVPGTLTVSAKTAQTITFGTLAAKPHGALDYAPGATATSSLTVTYASSNPAVATIVAGTIHIVGAGSTNITASQAGDATYAPASDVVQSLTVNKATLTVTADNTSRPFNTANPTFTASYSGYVGSDTFATSVTGAPGLTTTAILSSPVGPYPITAAVGTLASTNYSFSYVPGTLTVGATNQTITFANPGAQTFGTTPTLTATATSGLTPTFTSTTPLVCTITSGGALTFVTSGSCTIAADQAGNGTYNAAPQVPQTFTVNKANQSIGAITFLPTTLNVGGATTVSATATSDLAVTFASTTPLVCTVTGGTTVNGVSAGTCTITADQAGSGNYNAATQATQNIGVGKTTQTITFGALATKTYGNAPFAVSGSATSGLPVSFSILFGPATISAGTVSLTGAGTIVVRATQAGDTTYTAAPPVDQSFTVGKATLTVTADSTSRPFNTANPAFTASYSGYVGSDTFASSVTGAPSLTTTAILSSPVGPYPITAAVGTLASTNYNFSYVPGTLTVGATTQTISFGALAAKTYGAVDYVPGVTATSGLAVTYASSNPAVATIVAGTIHIVGAGSTNITASQAGDATYAPASDVVQSLTVNKASLTVTASSTGKTYGSANPALNYTIAGYLNGDTQAVVTGAPALATSATASSGIGSYPIIITAGTLSAANYSFTFVSGTLSVTPAALSIAAGSASRAYGAANPVVTAFTATGLVGSDSVASVTNGITAPANAAAGTTHAINPSAAVFGSGTAANYSITYLTGTLTITRAGLTVTADSVSKTFGAANPALTVSYAGFVNGDTATSLTTQPTASTTAVTASPAGPYPITASGGVSGNYSFTYVDGILTVSTKTVQTITFGTLTAKTYGALDYAPGATVDSPQTVTYASSNPAVATIVAGNIHIVGAGTTNITASQAGDATYAPASDVVQSLTVNKAALTVTANNTGKTYGAVNPALTVAYAGFVNGDTFASLTTQPTAATTAVTGSPATTYPITASGGVSGNYSFSYVGGTLTVNKAALTVTADSKSKIQGSANPALTVSYAGFVNGDTATSLTTQPTASTTAVTGSPAGPYPITASSGVSGNYTFNYAEGNLTVSPPDTYTITAGAGSDGSVTPTGKVTVTTGGSQTFSFTPIKGYYVKDVLVDGKSVGPVPSYTFSTLTANHTIKASFTAPDGKMSSNNSGVVEPVSIVDCVIAMRVAVGDVAPTPEQQKRGDVAPLVNGKPAPDGRIDLGDAVVILRKVVELVTW